MTIEEIIKKLEELEEQKKIQEVNEAKMIKETVFIMHPKQKWIVKTLGIKYEIRIWLKQ